jgi:MSHA biogenesis protein MshQ
MFSQINHDWDEGGVGRRCNDDDFLVRYQGFIRVPTTETYTFYTTTDDGFRLQIGRSVVIDDWEDQSPEVWNAVEAISLVANRRYALDAWLYENGGLAVAMLYYSVGGDEPSLVPGSWFSQR